MYTGFLNSASNRATWTFASELLDDATGAAIDLTGATIKIALGEGGAGQPILSGSTADGRVTISSPATEGIFVVAFPASLMQQLESDHYEVGIVVTLASGADFQLFAGALPVVNGVISL